MHLDLFQKVWVKRNKKAVAGTLIREKKGVYGVLIYYNGILKEYSITVSDFVKANENYWNYGLITNWPVINGLKKGTENKSGIVLADQIWYPDSVTKC